MSSEIVLKPRNHIMNEICRCFYHFGPRQAKYASFLLIFMLTTPNQRKCYISSFMFGLLYLMLVSLDPIIAPKARRKAVNQGRSTLTFQTPALTARAQRNKQQIYSTANPFMKVSPINSRGSQAGSNAAVLCDCAGLTGNKRPWIRWQ